MAKSQLNISDARNNYLNPHSCFFSSHIITTCCKITQIMTVHVASIEFHRNLTKIDSDI